MRKRILLSILSLVLVAGLTGCAQNQSENTNTNKNNNTSQTEVTTLKIGSLTIEENLPVLVAQQNGYFDEEKIKVEVVPFQSPVELQSAFQSGQLDGTITDLMIAALLKSSGEDLRVTSIALGSTPQEGRFAIVASPKSNIKSVQDLKGKSIGISNNSIIEYVTDGLLKQNGVDPGEVKKTTVAKIPVRVEMLLNNQIDAIIVPDPQITYVVSKGAKVIAEDTQGENLSQSVFIMKNKSIEDKGSAITNFYKAYTKAVNDLNGDPEKYKDLLVKNVNIPQDIVKDYKVQHYAKPQLPSEQEVKGILSWLKDKELLKQEVKYEDFVRAGLY